MNVTIDPATKKAVRSAYIALVGPVTLPVGSEQGRRRQRKLSALYRAASVAQRGMTPVNIGMALAAGVTIGDVLSAAGVI